MKREPSEQSKQRAQELIAAHRKANHNAVVAYEDDLIARIASELSAKDAEGLELVTTAGMQCRTAMEEARSTLAQKVLERVNGMLSDTYVEDPGTLSSEGIVRTSSVDATLRELFKREGIEITAVK